MRPTFVVPYISAINFGSPGAGFIRHGKGISRCDKDSDSGLTGHYPCVLLRLVLDRSCNPNFDTEKFGREVLFLLPGSRSRVLRTASRDSTCTRSRSAGSGASPATKRYQAAARAGRARTAADRCRLSEGR